MVAEADGERLRSIRVVETFAESYERTAKTTASGEVAFVAKEIADALRRCAKAILIDENVEPDATTALSKAFVESRPTKVDLSDQIIDA